MSFTQALQRTLDFEGGYNDDPADSGGATRFGITEALARQYGYKGAMKDLPMEKAVEIYKAHFWDAQHLDELPEIVAHELFESGVNCGRETAGKWFQRILNVNNNGGRYWKDIVVDGRIGPATLAAWRSYVRFRGLSGVERMVRALNALQGAHYITLAERRPKDEKWLYGWLGRI